MAGCAWVRIQAREQISPGGLAPERKKFAETILHGRLDAALHRLNTSLPESAIEEALRRVANYAGTSLIESIGSCMTGFATVSRLTLTWTVKNGGNLSKSLIGQTLTKTTGW